ncbi:MAG: hypothetical protein LM587_02670 [Candidatus Aenigmarchaeota archaeon]|nr:hypothetical protein [Candidatus Aenigmarchaeota archaeon]
MGAKIIVVERMETPTNQIMISYKIIDNGFTSPVGHIWIPKDQYSPEREKTELEKVLREYLEMKAKGLV